MTFFTLTGLYQISARNCSRANQSKTCGLLQIPEITQPVTVLFPTDWSLSFGLDLDSSRLASSSRHVAGDQHPLANGIIQGQVQPARGAAVYGLHDPTVFWQVPPIRAAKLKDDYVPDVLRRRRSARVP